MADEKETKSEGKLLAEKLFNERKNGFLKVDDEKIAEADAFCEGYKSFLNTAKTEGDERTHRIDDRGRGGGKGGLCAV